ncbi:hypothetical protein [Pedobacter ghigonis]|uniref:hypothetical protein n=1 Tax=Pedobacter ghigonis TaxID=2730403 RepID=UPI00158E13E6|nr:hypothetical protein [Pedobacter ghigonis]
MQEKLTINFDGETPAEAGKLALDLQSYLLSTENLHVNIEKDDADTQDFGATIVLILGSTAVTALTKGLLNWMIKKQDKKLTIKKDGEIKGENLSSDDIKNILDSLK